MLVRKSFLVLVFYLSAALPANMLWAAGSYYPEDFLTVPLIQPALFSPEGDALLNLVYKRGTYRLYLYDLEEDRNKRILQLGDYESVSSISWAGNEHIVYQLNHGPIWMVNRDGNSAKKLYDADSVGIGYMGIYVGNFETTQIVHVPGDATGDLIVSDLDFGRGVRLFKINLESGEEEEIAGHSRYFNFSTDHSGTIRIAQTLAGSRKLRFMHRWTEKESWKNLDKVLPESPARFQYDPSSVAGSENVLVGFDLDPEQVYMASNSQSDRMALYKLNLRSGEMQLVHEDPVYDVFSVDQFIEKIRLVFSQNQQQLAGFQYIAAKVESHWLLPSFQAVEDKFAELYPDRINLILGSDPHDRYFCTLSYSSRHPGTVLVYDSQEDKMHELGEVAPWIDEEDMAPMKPVSFKARDGHTIHGYLTMPKGDPDKEDSGPPPMVVLVHGGPWVRDTYGFKADVQWLANNGYSVFQINYRGSTGYGFKHLDMARLRYGIASSEDIADGVDWAVSEGFADAERVGIMGTSYGGYSAALGLAFHPEKFRCGISINGNLDIVDMTKTISRVSPMSYRYWKEFVGSVYKKDALRAVSPIDQVDKINKPMFVIAGEKDMIVPVEHSREFAAALEKHGIPHEFKEYAGEDHGISGRSNHVHLLESIVKFLNEHLPTAP